MFSAVFLPSAIAQERLPQNGFELVNFGDELKLLSDAAVVQLGNQARLHRRDRYNQDRTDPSGF
jgi:hypothetical protein